ncbi:MAG: MATE family efflux transporter, partial [Clostridia bacterium]
MQTLRRVCQPYVGTRSFYRGALAVMIPVTVQQLINNLFNMVDNLMVGSLDINGLAMSAVNVANKPYIIFFGVFFGLSGAAGLMISQYYGAKDIKTCQGLFALQMAIGLCNSLLFFALLRFFPETIMRIFVTDSRTVELGMQYLRIICYSYIPVAISNTCIFSMRSLGLNRTSMLVSLATMGVN